MVYTGSNKTYKSGPVDMPMVMYFYDEMAKGGDEDFFSALKKLGILAEVLVNRSEYYKDFAVTAKEHDHNELAEMITVSPRYIRIQAVLYYFGFLFNHCKMSSFSGNYRVIVTWKD